MRANLLWYFDSKLHLVRLDRSPAKVIVEILYYFTGVETSSHRAFLCKNAGWRDM